jgi:formylmethanofuran dehydrogenase subunit E
MDYLQISENSKMKFLVERNIVMEFLHPTGIVNCTQCGEEVMNEREVEVNGRLLCQHCAYASYYVTHDVLAV